MDLLEFLKTTDLNGVYALIILLSGFFSALEARRKHNMEMMGDLLDAADGAISRNKNEIVEIRKSLKRALNDASFWKEYSDYLLYFIQKHYKGRAKPKPATKFKLRREK